MKKARKLKVYTSGQRWALVAFFAVLSIASIVLVTFTYVQTSSVLVRKVAEVSLGETAAQVDSWVDAKGGTIEDLAAALLELKGEPSFFQPYFARILMQDKDFIDIFYGTVEGPSAGGHAVYASSWVAPGDYNWTTRPWFTQALGQKGLVVSAPYKDLQTGKIIISISKAIYRNNRLIGVLSSDISTATIRSIVAGDFVAKGADIGLVNKDGDYIAFGEGKEALEGNAFDSGPFAGKRASFLGGDFSFASFLFPEGYLASIGVPRLGWFILASGSLTNFADISRSALTLVAILLFLAVLFITVLTRSWRTGVELQLATDRIEKANRGLEKTVEERTASLRNILDAAGEGFFTFGSSFAIDPDYSKGCVDILGREIAGLSAPDVLFPGMTETVAEFRQGFSLYFEGKTKAGIIFDLTEKQTAIRDRTVHITYKETSGQRILCILTDVTLAAAMEEKNRAESETQQRVLRALHHKLFFAQFLESAEDLFSRLAVYAEHAPSEEELTDFIRAMHTFKGNAGFFSFTATQGLAHEAETLMSDSRLLGSTVSFREMLEHLRKAYWRELKAITDTMGEKWIDETSGISIPRDSYHKLLAYVRKKTPQDPKLILYLDSFRKVSLAELFSRLPFAASATAERLGKKVAPMTISGGGQKLVPDGFQALAESCVHIVNNMVDHGIEYPYEREALQKNPEGRLELVISVEKGVMLLEFKDDGRGINPREIERIAREKGLIPEGRNLQNSELYDFLFFDGFSTRKEVTTVSGRGVGLAAVHAEVAKLGGTIEVRSRLGKGSSFELTIPLSANA
jgi:two-component system chemotaxis sensor kinase CheA